MNIIEALKTGLPLTRASKETWRMRDRPHVEIGWARGFFGPQWMLDTVRLTVDDIVADDWQVEEAQRHAD